MAEENDDIEELGTTTSKKKIVIIIVIGVVLMALSAGGTLMALGLLSDDPESAELVDGEQASEDGAEAAEEVKKPAIYYPMKPPMIISFNVRGRQRFLQAEISLMMRDTEVLADIEEHSALLQNGLLMLFSSQDYAELQTPEGKELLRQQSLGEVQKLLEQETGKPGVEQVLFTAFVMQ
ncbi:flagellar basal body-associated FliL family protein [Pseudomaricurvus sp.]|uniref:flagellar basal body-associated FliL family protein n=1 Tax=Pseudomaricurvus sp. TaxID=2004510 RepID=UPI003F6A99B0